MSRILSVHGGGGMHGRVCVCGRGHAWWGACKAGETATAADSTHPTGIHSCTEGLHDKYHIVIIILNVFKMASGEIRIIIDSSKLSYWT